MKFIILLFPVILFAREYTISGERDSVQAYIGKIAEGDTITLKAGSYTWSSPVNINGKGLTLRGIDSSKVKITTATNNFMINVTEARSQSIYITDLSINKGSYGASFIYINDNNGKPVVIGRCRFTWYPNASGSNNIMVYFDTRKGLVYDCFFDLGGWSYDVQVIQALKCKNLNDSASWRTADTMGDKDIDGEGNLYVEDCTFRDFHQGAFDWDDNSRTVTRYCDFYDCASGGHGFCTSPYGARHWEFYNNRYFYDSDQSDYPSLRYPDNINPFIWNRGGTGVIFNNTFQNITSQAWGNKPEILFSVFAINRNCGQIPCCTNYPCERQIGQGYDGSKYFTDPVYLWNNQGTFTIAVGGYNPDECGNGQKISDYLQVNRDYYNNTPKPGYQPFTYPHPLRTNRLDISIKAKITK